MASAAFVHLHCHTEYSLLDGAIRVSDLVEKVRGFGCPAVAVTDHGAMHGTVEFYKAARSAGVKPVFGCEVYVAPGHRGGRELGPSGQSNYHLTLLARNQLGYRNLCRLVTLGYQEGFYRKPRVDKELLAELGSGLVALSGCVKGEVAQAVLREDLEQACRLAEEYSDIFGTGRFYLELMDNGLAEQARANRGLIEVGRRVGLPLVATNDCHYLDRCDARSHEVLVCVQTGKTFDDPSRMRMGSDAFYVKSPEEMGVAFAHCPEALAATVEIAGCCDVELDLKTFHFPDFRSDRAGEGLDDCLARRALEGLERRLEERGVREGEDPEEVRRSYADRLGMELGVIRQMGFAGYFLIVEDFIRWSRSNGVPVGPGRGSAAGSLVAYSLGITSLDPIRYRLLFERFLNPERVSLPDIDIDFCMDNRDKAIRYVTERYGEERVAQITTFGQMRARAVVRDVGRVLGVALAEVDRVAKMVPARPNMTIERALEEEPRLRQAVAADPRMAELFEHARRLEGLSRHASTHAAGIVIGDRPLVDYLPLYRGKQGEMVTQFSMKSVEAIGLVKFDFLGLKTLTVMVEAQRCANARRPGERVLDVDRVPLDDPEVYEMLSKGRSTGVFQLEGAGMRDLMVRLKPSSFEDLIALVALYRPGPLGSGMVDDFIRRKHGLVPIEYDLPELEGILRDTYGVIVYQEQVMQIAKSLAGYSLGEADLLRKAMGKKIPEEMARQKDRFVGGATQRGVDGAVAERIFELMAQFAEYGFNRSHSCAYALIAYQTAYLKCHYPVEFMCALLTSERGDPDKIAQGVAECRDMNIAVLPPDINESGVYFSVVGPGIRFGLSAVKNVGEGAVEALIEARQSGGPFASLEDVCARVDSQKVNRKVLESLIRVGALDRFGGSREQYLAHLDVAMSRGAKQARDHANGQASLLDLCGVGSAGRECLPEVERWSERQRLDAEQELLGVYLSGHPLDRWKGLLAQYADTDVSEAKQGPDRAEVVVGGMVVSRRPHVTGAGKTMGFASLQDLSGTVEMVFFPNVWRRVGPLLECGEPVLAQGIVERGDDAVKLLVEDVMLLAEAPERLTRSVDVVVDARVHDASHLRAVRGVLGDVRHAGGTRVRVLVRVSDAAEVVVWAEPETFRVQPSRDLQEDLGRVLGSGSWVVFQS